MGPLFAVAMSSGAFVVALGILVQMLGYDDASRRRMVHLFSWVPAGQFQLDAGLQLDQLSLSFVLLVTFVGSLIHVYSLGTWSTTRQAALLRLPQPFVAAMLCSSSPTPTCCCMSAGRAWVWRPTCSSVLEPQPGLRDRGEQGVRRQPVGDFGWAWRSC